MTNDELRKWARECVPPPESLYEEPPRDDWMATDIKAELRRLVELQHELLSLEPSMETADIIRFGYSTHRLKEAAKNADFSAVLQRLEELEAVSVNYHGECDCCGVANADMLTDDYCSECRICELESDVRALEASCESLTRQNDDLLTKSVEWAKEVKRLRQVLAGEIAAQAQERGEYDVEPEAID